MNTGVAASASLPLMGTEGGVCRAQAPGLAAEVSTLQHIHSKARSSCATL